MQDFFFLKTNGDYTRVSYADIVYVECLKNYVRIVTRKTAFIVLVTMKHVEELLPPDKFCRIHRSYIVALNHINKFNSKCAFMGEKELPISEQYRESLIGKVITLTPESRTKENFCDN